MQCGAAVARALAEPCCSGRRLEAAQPRHGSVLLPARSARRAGRCGGLLPPRRRCRRPCTSWRVALKPAPTVTIISTTLVCRRQLRAAALLGELDLQAAASSLQASLPHLAHLPAAAADQLAALAAHPGVSHDTLAQLLTLGDAAAQRIADLADAAAAAAEPAKKDNGWLQPLVTALETVLTFIEVGQGADCLLGNCSCNTKCRRCSSSALSLWCCSCCRCCWSMLTQAVPVPPSASGASCRTA